MISFQKYKNVFLFYYTSKLSGKSIRPPEYTDRCTSAAKRGKRLIFQLREEICFSRLCFNYITTFTKLVMEIGKLLIQAPFVFKLRLFRSVIIISSKIPQERFLFSSNIIEEMRCLQNRNAHYKNMPLNNMKL